MRSMPGDAVTGNHFSSRSQVPGYRLEELARYSKKNNVHILKTCRSSENGLTDIV